MIKIIKEYQRKNKNYKKVLEKKIKTMKTDWKIMKNNQKIIRIMKKGWKNDKVKKRLEK